jgi:hypothetical protein
MFSIKDDACPGLRSPVDDGDKCGFRIFKSHSRGPRPVRAVFPAGGFAAREPYTQGIGQVQLCPDISARPLKNDRLPRAGLCGFYRPVNVSFFRMPVYGMRGMKVLGKPARNHLIYLRFLVFFSRDLRKQGEKLHKKAFGGCLFPHRSVDCLYTIAGCTRLVFSGL